jgi:glyoxylase-like metal-dependent hydrolase (beta-lactamase superfamily II)
VKKITSFILSAVLFEYMHVHCIYGRNFDSNIYVITGEKTTIIDCGTGLNNEWVVREVKKLVDPVSIKQIIITHEHFDHCGGVRKLFELTESKAKIMAHKEASDKIERGESDFAKMLGGVMPKMPVDVKLKDGDTVIVGDEKFEVLHTPGHTPGSMCLYSKASKTLISGDTIFSGGWFGRYDFPSGDKHLLRQSIERLAKLDVVNLYPGHEPIVEGDGRKHMMMVLENIRSDLLWLCLVQGIF